MSLIDRAKNILISPKSEWAAIDAEEATTGGLFTGYAIILALLPVIGTLLAVGLSLGPYRYFGFNYFLITALASYAIGLGILFLMGIIANALSTSFDGTKNDVQAMKLVVYSATPGWIAGFFGFIPGLNILLSLAAFGYSAYLLYLGSQAVVKVPEGKAVGYTAVTIIIWIILSMVITAIIVGALVTALIGGVGLGAYR
jgi:hypothetical protein